MEYYKQMKPITFILLVHVSLFILYEDENSNKNSFIKQHASSKNGMTFWDVGKFLSNPRGKSCCWVNGLVLKGTFPEDPT